MSHPHSLRLHVLIEHFDANIEHLNAPLVCEAVSKRRACVIHYPQKFARHFGTSVALVLFRGEFPIQPKERASKVSKLAHYGLAVVEVPQPIVLPCSWFLLVSLLRGVLVGGYRFAHSAICPWAKKDPL